eukprot:TRINITY_DN6584_c0_g1_i1.p1 TRINITY_DN6584_c0_g1~~TRINITY_DN6584_c0_g1_i1.p1  ORF type:complete len:231 (-),score=38.45 TRINITY_DN6584_c0_g1_i1:8-700(-)
MATAAKPKTTEKDEPLRFTQQWRQLYMMTEYKQLRDAATNLLRGIYVMPGPDCFKAWNGVLFMRNGLYRKGVFKFTITFPDDYPHACPTVKFTTRVFHPQVAPDGRVDVSAVYNQCVVGTNNIVVNILVHLKKIFFKIEITQPKNPDAAHLHRSDMPEFERRVQACINASQRSAVEGQNAKGLAFSPCTDEEAEIMKQCVLSRPTDGSQPFEDWMANCLALRNLGQASEQ